MHSQSTVNHEARDNDDLEVNLNVRNNDAAMRLQRELRDETQGETWKTFLDHPSAFWSFRKCNILMNLTAAMCCILTSVRNCGIPLGFWLSVQFFFFIVELGLLEVRERM